MARLFSAIFVCVLLQIIRIKADDGQVLDINKGILVSGNSEDRMLEVVENSDSSTIRSSLTTDLLEDFSGGGLKNITHVHPESSRGHDLWKMAESFRTSSPPSSNYSDKGNTISTNSTKIDTASSPVNAATTQGFLTSQYSIEDNDTVTRDYYPSSQRINFSDTLYSLMENNVISSQLIPQYPQEPITNPPEDRVSLDQARDGTTILENEYHKRQENAIYKSTEETTEFQSYSSEESFSFDNSYPVNENIGAFKTLPSEDSSQYPNISAYNPRENPFDLLSMSIYPSENRNYTKKSTNPYLLMSLDENVPDESLSLTIRNYRSSNNSINPLLKKRSVTIETQSTTIRPLLPNMNTIPDDQSLIYSTESSDYLTLITGSDYQSESINFIEENDSVTLQNLPETTESLSRVNSKEPFTFAKETTPYYTSEPSKHIINDILDYSPSPENVDNEMSDFNPDTNTEQTDNITTLYTEAPSSYSTDFYTGTTLEYSNSRYTSYHYSESANESSSSHNLGSSEDPFWFESARTAKTRLTSQQEENSMATTAMMDPVITTIEIQESQEPMHAIDTSDSNIYHSEKQGSHLIDIMINKTTEKRPQYLSSSLDDPAYIYSKDGLEISTVVRSNNQTEEMHHLNKKVTYYNSVPKNTSIASDINVYHTSSKAGEIISTEQDLNDGSEQGNMVLERVPNETILLSNDKSETYTSQTLRDSSEEPLSSIFSPNHEIGMITYITEQSYEILNDGYNKAVTKSTPNHVEERDEISNYEEFRLSRERKYQSGKDFSVRETIILNEESIYLHPLNSPGDTLLEEPMSSWDVKTNDHSDSTHIAEGTAKRLRSGYSAPNHAEATSPYSPDIKESNSHSEIRYYIDKNTTNRNQTLVNMYAQESSKKILFKVNPSFLKDVSINKRRIISKSIATDHLKRLADDTVRDLKIYKHSEKKMYDMGALTTERTNEILPEFITNRSIDKSHAVTNSDPITSTSTVYEPNHVSNSYATEQPKTSKPLVNDYSFKQALPSNNDKPYRKDLKVFEDIRTRADDSKNVNINYIFPAYVIQNPRNPQLEHLYNLRKFYTPKISKKYNRNFFPQIKCLHDRLFRQNGYRYPLGPRNCYYPYLYPLKGYTPQSYYRPSSMYKF